MFINTIEFPPIKTGKEEEFRQWFVRSNEVYSKFAGLISRRLLKSTKEAGKYVTLVEHESRETFMAMHTSQERQAAWEELKPLLEGSLKPSFYETVEL